MSSIRLASKMRLAEQSTVVAVAEMTYRNRASLTEVASLSLKEYADYLYKLDLAEAQAAIYKAESDLAQATDAVEAGKKNAPGRLSQNAARFALEAANLRKKGLVDYSKPKRLRELELAIDSARAEETASKCAGRWR